MFDSEKEPEQQQQPQSKPQQALEQAATADQQQQQQQQKICIAGEVIGIAESDSESISSDDTEEDVDVYQVLEKEAEAKNPIATTYKDLVAKIKEQAYLLRRSYVSTPMLAVYLGEITELTEKSERELEDSSILREYIRSCADLVRKAVDELGLTFSRVAFDKFMKSYNESLK